MRSAKDLHVLVSESDQISCLCCPYPGYLDVLSCTVLLEGVFDVVAAVFLVMVANRLGLLSDSRDLENQSWENFTTCFDEVLSVASPFSIFSRLANLWKSIFCISKALSAS